MLSDFRFQDFTDTGKSIGAYIVFYQGGTIDHYTHVPGPVDQSSAKSEYNAACTAEIYISHFRIINNDFLVKYTDVVPEKEPIIILDRKSAVCMVNNSKDTKHTRHIFRIMHFIRNGK